MVHVKANTACVSRSFSLEEKQECRILLFCKDPEITVWVDAVVWQASEPFGSYPYMKGVKLLGQGKFLLHDYLQVVGKSMLNFFQTFEQYDLFSRQDCEVLARLAGTRELRKGETLFKAGDFNPDENDLYLLTGGALKAYKYDAGNPGDNIAGIVAGQMVGEMSLVDNQPHSASISALMHTWLIQFSRTGVLFLEKSNPQLFIRLYKLIARTLVRRLTRTTRR